ncbi:probable receptor-like protein kinase At2g23200 [Lactuca sativa]|uniref:Protein kinase domain-containing protein n=1 Tax=Lactuca sativa TaxID=4236 RepID=A0A9R1XDY2_LACSA|nr:probable receptor-like protein kinase At2g23200 [Lactuca sativa]KAJ0210865.1 hypothetical protein LSAT_V11C400219870 [Lactuca sativa]
MTSIMSFFLVILLSSLSLASSQYALPDHYFINCGSNSDVNFTNRKFVGDVNPSTFSISGGHVAAESNNPASDTPVIYRTARVFTKKSRYELEADDINTFVMVRLHFSQFSSNGLEFSNSKLDVSVSGFSLLSGFSTGNTTVIREFIFPIGSERKFRIEFTPSRGSSSAFVNAIEAFTTPSNLFRPASSFPRISPAGSIGDLENVTSDYAFNPIHRVNVGGQTINVNRDTLRRTWTPDNSFIFNNGQARNVTFDDRPNYVDGGASSFDAPDDVYKTAKQLNNSLVNITWIFNVNENAMYLVRAHFCDIISTALVSPTDAFNFFVYSHHKEEIQPGNTIRALHAPFYLDLVVESNDSNRLNISIGAIRGNNQPVFLNGVEIMQMLKNSGVPDPAKKKGKSVFIVVGCVVAGVAFLLVLLAGFFIGSRCGKGKQVVVGAKSESHVVPSHGRSTSYTSINVDFTVNNPSPVLDLNLRVPFADIVQATNNFDENLMIGRGGFGKVYKGTLHGTKVAVKRGEQGHGQGRPEFVTEIMVLSRIRYKHLVSLIGYCDENNEMLLVYEFMEKGTLQDHLYDSDLPRLSWERRLEMCISATRGLHYLHTGSEGGIIHRDVKSTNILLNEHYVAKVADFGISRLENVDEGEHSDVKGSFGYLDPEYVRCMKLTQKSDVYSFGVLLLEVLCARPALDHKLPAKEVNLADWAIKQIKNGNLEKIIDPFLMSTINQDSLRKFVEIAERCLKETGDERPSMVDVLWDLEYVLKLQLMSVDRESYDDTTINTSFQLPMSIIDSSISSYPSESEVFSQLKIDEAQ